MSVFCSALVMYMCMSRNRPSLSSSGPRRLWACSTSSWVSKCRNHSKDRWSRLIQKKSTLVKLYKRPAILSAEVHDFWQWGHWVWVDQNLQDMILFQIGCEIVTRPPINMRWGHAIHAQTATSHALTSAWLTVKWKRRGSPRSRSRSGRRDEHEKCCWPELHKGL